MKQIITRLIDDIDGTEAEHTVQFGIDGTVWEIDLSTEHRNELFEFMAKYRDAGRLMRLSGGWKAYEGKGPRAKASSGRSKEELAEIRVWARANGHTVSDRGRIPDSVMQAYMKRDETAPAEQAEQAEPVEPTTEDILHWWNEVKKFKTASKVTGLMRSKYRVEVIQRGGKARVDETPADAGQISIDITSDLGTTSAA